MAPLPPPPPLATPTCYMCVNAFQIIARILRRPANVCYLVFVSQAIGAGSGVPGGAQAPPELFLAPPELFEPPLTMEKIMH